MTFRYVIEFFILCEISLIISASSVNKPKLSPCASWNLNGSVIVNNSNLDRNYFNAFISRKNTLYVVDYLKRILQIQLENQPYTTQQLIIQSNIPSSLFVINDNDVYIDDRNRSQVIQWSLKTSSNKTIMYVNRGCKSLFIHMNTTLYCTINNGHLVIKMFLNINNSTLLSAAGTGCPGPAANMLDQPFGIYVNDHNDLYIADTGNDRIQLFPPNETNGLTVAGKGIPASLILNRPTHVILDEDNDLYIVDQGNQRILRLRSQSYQCIIGCSTRSTCSPDQPCDPLSALFDSYGNLYIVNDHSIGIQRFLLKTNSCEPTTVEITTESQTTTITSVPQRTTITLVPQTCFPPDVTLFPGPTYFDNPFPFRRSQDFYIISNIKLRCLESFEFDLEWSIYNCTPNCSTQRNKIENIKTNLSEIYVPARSLVYGLYEFRFRVRMSIHDRLVTTVSAFIQINPSGIAANLVQYGTSIITSGEWKNLTLDPGTYSVNPDETSFNASDWTYEYQCRLYDSIEISRWTSISELNNSCFTNRPNSLAWIYNSVNASNSSLTILAGSLKANRTYQFVVSMTNIRNASAKATGYLSVRIAHTLPQMVAVACVISTMCSLNVEYQFINPTTQVALFSDCVDRCLSTIERIQWNIYQGINQTSKDIVQWTPFTQNLHFYGINTTNFTALNSLFLDNKNISLWRFEVVYTFVNENSSSALNFIINQPPSNGNCSITPQNGTISTLFTINCTGWFDEDKIKDYSFYQQTDSFEQIMLTFTVSPTIKLRLASPKTENTSLIIHIRDQLNCIAEYRIEGIIVRSDDTEINMFVDTFDNFENKKYNNSILRELASGNQNTVGQIVTSLAQEFNKKNKENLAKTIASGIPASTVSISPLGASPDHSSSSPSNASIIREYIENLHKLAHIRDFLLKTTTNLAFETIDSIKLQATTLAQLTSSTNELTQTSSMLASEKCYQLAFKLESMKSRVSREDAQLASNQIALCVNNVLTAINAPLQNRSIFFSTEKTNFDDYDEELEFVDFLAKENDKSSENLIKQKTIFYQKKIANQIVTQSADTISLLTSVLNIHLNLGQNLSMISSSLHMFFETTTINSLANKSISQVGNVSIHLPKTLQSNRNLNTSISVRSTMQPLAPMGASQYHAHTNLSTMISLSIFESNRFQISVHANDEDPIEVFIPRDPNLIIPEMKLQDVYLQSCEKIFSIDLNQYLTNKNLTISIHFEIQPSDTDLAYLFLYQFDKKLSKNNIHNWTVFCPSNLTNDKLYKYYLNNRQTSGHRSILYQLIELNTIEAENYCRKNQTFQYPQTRNFTSNFQLRIYSSGCYYLDQYNNWQSEGLWVGPLTDHYRTQCFSNHLSN